MYLPPNYADNPMLTHQLQKGRSSDLPQQIILPGTESQKLVGRCLPGRSVQLSKNQTLRQYSEGSRKNSRSKRKKWHRTQTQDHPELPCSEFLHIILMDSLSHLLRFVALMYCRVSAMVILRPPRVSHITYNTHIACLALRKTILTFLFISCLGLSTRSFSGFVIALLDIISVSDILVVGLRGGVLLCHTCQVLSLLSVLAVLTEPDLHVFHTC